MQRPTARDAFDSPSASPRNPQIALPSRVRINETRGDAVEQQAGNAVATFVASSTYGVTDTDAIRMATS
jgi:hypothetical protein